MNPPHAFVADPHRLGALEAFSVLDSPPEQEFDDVVHLTARLCDTPVALVSLVDRDRQWFKAKVGFPAGETDLESSVCKFVLSEPDLLIFPDLTLDPRTRSNPLVTGEAGIRFYAGAPLRTEDGQVLGSLCAIDTQPRPGGLTSVQQDDLRILARLTMLQLEARRAAIAREQSDREARALVHLGDRLRAIRDPLKMAHVAAEIIGRTLNATRAGYAVVTDVDKSLITIEADWRAPSVSSLVGEHDLKDFGSLIDDLHKGEIILVSDVARDPRTQAAAAGYQAVGIRTMINVPLLEQGKLVALQFVHFAKPQANLAAVEPFVKNVMDRVRLNIERVRAEEQQVVVNHEISHRLKNTLAMVQAIAAQTLKGVSERGPVEAFGQRIQALSSAHDLLLGTNWTSADLAQLISAVMENLGELARCDAEGPAILLAPSATLSASLLIHELSTNALKYGSLSQPAGSVKIRWVIEGEAEGATIHLTWTEQDGPPAAAPTRKGFGSRLLAMGLVGTGGARLSYPPEGFQAAFSASLAQAKGV